MIDKGYLQQSCKVLGIEVTDTAADKLDRYARLLVEKNKVMNLTAITEPIEVVNKHFIDSLLLLKHVNVKQGAALIDVGTGAGFPAIPCKVVRDDLRISLLDSLNKRVNFLNEVTDDIGITVNAVHGRAEELGLSQKLGFREQFDIATARAVANLRDLSEYCLPFVKIGGVFVSLKGPDITAEVEQAENAIKILGGEVLEVVSYSLPDDSARTMVIVKKVKPTPPNYPRNAGRMKKSPL